jgi:cytochrome c
MSFEVNKIFGAVVLALLVAYLAGFIAKETVHAEESEVMAFPVGELKLAAATGTETTAAPAVVQVDPIEPLLAAADPAAGQKTARVCGACHNVEKGAANKVGPVLWGVVGRVVASVDSFSYSDGMKSHHDRKWTYDELNHFLYNPKAHVAGTKMAFAGLKDTKERANLVAYLRTLSDAPEALPAK